MLSRSTTTSRPALDHALGPLQHHLGDPAVVFDRLVEGGAVDLAVHRPPHVGDLLGPLADERDHYLDVGCVDGDAVGHLLEYGGLAGLGRRDDEPALSAAGRREHVYQARGELLRGDLHLDHLRREDGRERLELGPAPRGVGLDAVDDLDPDQSEVALSVLGRADLPGDLVAGAQSEAADLRLRHVYVPAVGGGAVLLEEAVAVVDDGQDTAGNQLAVLLGVGLEHGHDQLLPPGLGPPAEDAQRGGDLDQLLVGLGL